MNEGSQTISLGYTETPKCSDYRDSQMLGKHSYKLSYIPVYVA